MMYIVNFIMAVLDFGLMAYCLYEGSWAWLVCLVSGCYCLGVGIFNVIMSRKAKALVDEEKIEETAEKMAEEMLEKILNKKK